MADILHCFSLLPAFSECFNVKRKTNPMGTGQTITYERLGFPMNLPKHCICEVWGFCKGIMEDSYLPGSTDLALL